MDVPVKKILIGVAIAVLLLFTGCQTIGRITTIKSGEVGIKVRNVDLGSGAGVDLREMPQGTHIRAPFEEIERYNVRQRVYSFTKEANQDGKENEEIAFNDKTGLQVFGDVQMTLQARPDRAADIYAKYKLDLNDLIDGPIRNDMRSFISEEAEKIPVSCSISSSTAKTADGVVQPDSCTEQLIGEGRQPVLQRAAKKLSEKWALEGVTITSVRWVGGLRYPPQIGNAIQQRTAIEQETLAAQQQQAKEHALAEAKIEKARGDAESVRLQAQAAKDSTALIDKIYAERSRGFCPPGTKTCIVGGNALTQVGGGE